MNLHSFFRFGIVGTAGFCVDAGFLYLSLFVGLDYFSGRIISFLLAVIFTWQLNRRFTFEAKHSLTWWQEAWRYMVVSSTGGAVNIGIYSVTILLMEPQPLTPLIAIALGSIGGMAFNYIAAKRFVFLHAAKRK